MGLRMNLEPRAEPFCRAVKEPPFPMLRAVLDNNTKRQLTFDLEIFSLCTFLSWIRH
jgi:hypothetical protein